MGGNGGRYVLVLEEGCDEGGGGASGGLIVRQAGLLLLLSIVTSPLYFQLAGSAITTWAADWIV